MFTWCIHRPFLYSKNNDKGDHLPTFLYIPLYDSVLFSVLSAFVLSSYVGVTTVSSDYVFFSLANNIMKTIDNIKNIKAITDTIINPVFADSYDKPPIISLLEKFFSFIFTISISYLMYLYLITF